MSFNNYPGNKAFVGKDWNIAFWIGSRGLGDTICATPTLRRLNKTYDKPITVFTHHPDVFRNNPRVKECLHIDEFSEDNDFDEVLYTYQNPHSEEHNMFKHNLMDIRQMHANDLGFTLLPEEMECEFYPDELEWPWGEKDGYRKENPKYIVFHCTQTWPSRTWAQENWEILAKKINDGILFENENVSVVVIGENSAEIGTFNTDKPVFDIQPKLGINLQNKTTIHQVWNLIDKAIAVVTNDSGILHLAGTTDTHMIVLGGSIHPALRLPYRNGRQYHKLNYVVGSCVAHCTNNIKHGIDEHGTFHGIPPLPFCLEGRDAYDCHPVVDDVYKTLYFENEYLQIDKEIFDDECYKSKDVHVQEGDVVVDLGACHGSFTLYAFQRGAKKVYSVEPFEENLKRMTQRMVDFNYFRNYIPTQKAISNKKGKAYLSLGDSIPGSDLPVGGETFEPSPSITDDSAENSIMINTISFMDFIDMHDIEKIDLLKIDIEGSEYDVVEDERTHDYFRNNIDRITGELHLHGGDVQNFIELIESFGFELNFTACFGDMDITTQFRHNYWLSDRQMHAHEYYNEVIFFAHKPNKKKIIYVTPHCSTGGGPEVLRKWVEMMKDECEVHVVEFTFYGGYDVQRKRIIEMIGESNFHTLGGLEYTDGIINYEEYVEKRMGLWELIKKIKPDVVHFNEVPELTHYGGFPETLGDLIYSEDREYLIFETSHDSMWDVNHKLWLPDKFIFISKWHLDVYKHFDVPMEVIEYPVEVKERPDRVTTLEELGLDPEYKHVLNVGIWSRRKNQGEIVEMARLMEKDKVKFHFVGPYASNFEEYWKPYMDNLPDNCVVWNERDDVDKFCSCMDLFLFTSRGDDSDKETNPIVLKEALSWQMPNIMLYNLDVYLGKYDEEQSMTFLSGNREEDTTKLKELLNLNKVIDCFMFSTEVDMLDFRLSYLDDVVDYFILVESTKTHSGMDKPLHFIENKDRYERYLDKIVHVVVEDLPTEGDSWKKENYQRSRIEDGLKQLELNPSDIIMISDIDEIPDVDRLVEIKNSDEKEYCYVMEQDCYYYNVTCRSKDKWYGTKVLDYAHYIKHQNSPDKLAKGMDYFNWTRLFDHHGQGDSIKKGGWHFSWFGDVEFIQDKIKAFAHQEYNNEKYLDEEYIKTNIKNATDFMSEGGLDTRKLINFEKIPIEENTYLPNNNKIFFSELDTESVEHESFVMEYFKNDSMAIGSIAKDIKWEPHVSKFVELYNNSFPIQNIIDVGANFGYHTLLFSKSVAENGFVYAYEPQIQNFTLLYKNIKMNDIENVLVYNKACSDVNDIVKMPMIKKDSGIVNMGDFTPNWVDATHLYCDVESIMLDDIKFPEISLIKLDVQGWESKVLNGAKKLIKKYKPALIVEFEHIQFLHVEDGGSCDDLAKLIKDMGYTIFYLEWIHPSDHICIHDDNLKEFNEQFSNYILPHAERNDVNDNISFTNKKLKLDYKE